MTKYIVLSVNDNPDYSYYIPLCAMMWKRFGWEPILMYRGEENELFKLATQYVRPDLIFRVDKIEGYRDDTITQISRLYPAVMFGDDAYLMTSDADMIPLSDYFQPKEDDVTVYGYDLTDYTQYPICYIGMKAKKWKEIFGIDNFGMTITELIKSDLDLIPQAKDPDFYNYWFTDQLHSTSKLNEYGQGKLTLINRGKNSKGYALGRIDRGDWNIDSDTYIDSHLMRVMYKNTDHFDAVMSLLNKVFPNDNFQWLIDYTKKFNEILNPVMATEKIFKPIEHEMLYPLYDKQEYLENILAEDKFGFLPDTGVWGSHRPLLYLALELTTENKLPILEMGSGRDSSPFIRNHCIENEKEFLSYDSNEAWAKISDAIYVPDWDRAGIYDKEYSVAFIDLAPGEYRKVALRLLMGKADIIVIHDMEKFGAGDYGCEPTLELFKYRINYNLTQGGAGVSAVSNTIDLSIFDKCTLGKYLLEK